MNNNYELMEKADLITALNAVNSDMELLAKTIIEILKKLGMISPKGEINFEMRNIMRSLPSIILSASNGSGKNQFEFIKDIFPLLEKYKYILDETTSTK